MYNEITELSVEEIEIVAGGYWPGGAVLAEGVLIAWQTAANAIASGYDKILEVGESIGEQIASGAAGQSTSSAE